MSASFISIRSYFRNMVAVLKDKISQYFKGRNMRKLKKPLVIMTSITVIVVLVAILFISPITKYLIEKYDVKYTGRQVTLDWAYVNPFTGYIYLKNVKIYELKSDSLFLSAKSIRVDFALRKLITKTIEISSLSLDEPRVIIVQDQKNLNVNDLIKKFISDGGKAKTKSPVRFSVLRIKITDGEIHYRDKLVPINYFIKDVKIESTGKRWDKDTIHAKFSFLSGIGSGEIKGKFSIDIKSLNYRLSVTAQKFDLNILVQYLRDLTNYGSFAANLDADLKVKGSFKNAENVTFSGLLAINDFHFGKTRTEDYASFDKISVAIYELSPINHKYLFDSVSLSHPYISYERYDNLDNFQRMFVLPGSTVLAAQSSNTRYNLLYVIGNYIKDLSRNFFRSNYKINRMAIYNGNLAYNDYTLNEKFSMKFDPLFVLADSIAKKDKRAKLFLKSGIQPYGNASLTLSINPKDSSDFDLKYNVQKLPASLFNPYTIAYTSFPLDRGTIALNGTWHVRNGNIQSENHLLIIDPRVSRRLRNKDAKWIPVPLIMSFIRERGNVIDYQIPISGDLKNPKFHLRDVLSDLLKNIFIKPPTTPYGFQVKNIETEIEKSLTLKWEMRQSSLRPMQEKFMERMADFLAENPDAYIAVHPQQYAIKEKEYILLFEAKKKYFLEANRQNGHSFSGEDSTVVDKMSIRDAMFVHYLNRHIKDSLLFTIQAKCTSLIGNALINAKFKQLSRERANALLFYFRHKGVEKQVRFASAGNEIPYNGFSYYKIEYKGEYPKALIKAYGKMNELNEAAPRKKFYEQRKKNRIVR